MSPQDPGDGVAVIGLGAMGLPMAARLAETRTVTAFEPAAARRGEARAHGIVVADDPAAAARGADVVLLAVRDAAQVRAAVFGPGGVASALAGDGVVILTSTIGLEAARSLADDLARLGVALVDAPVSGGPVRAASGDLLIVVGGAPEARDRAGGVLERLASTLTVVGDRPGDGQIVKTINQLLAGVHIAAAAEALALARELGLDPAGLVPVLSAGAASSFMLADRGPRMAQAYDGGAEVRSRLDIFVKDMGIVAELARAAHVPTPLAAAAEQLYVLAERAGLGEQDDSSLITVLSPKAGAGEDRP
jgi:3-hydroxyisobutyrate dehydrogenase